MGRAVVRFDGHWTRVLEASQSEARTDDEWLGSIVDASGEIFSGFALGMTALKYTPNGDAAFLGYALPAVLRPFLDGVLTGLKDPLFLRAFYHPPAMAATYTECADRYYPHVKDRNAAAREIGFGTFLGDAVGLFAHPEPGIVVSIFALQEHRVTLTRRERDFLARVAVHIESNFRLRHRPEIVKAVIDSDGRVLERHDELPDARTLSEHTLRIERARSERNSDSDLWPALLAGRLSFIERKAGRKRRYLVVENAPASQKFRTWKSSEVDVVAHAARGLSTKLIGYGLGISSSTVSHRLASATAKVGLASRAELIRLAGLLAREPNITSDEAALTDAEQDVLMLLKDGLSNAEIATMRSRSVRTIANQVASILRKTKRSRRELVAHT